MKQNTIKLIQIAFMLCITGAIPMYSQFAIDLDWQRPLGGSLSEGYCDLTIGQNGNFIILGSATSTDGDVHKPSGIVPSNTWLVEITPLGDTIRTLWLASENYSYTDKIIALADGGYLITGSNENTNFKGGVGKGITKEDEDYDIYVIKLDANWVVEWDSTYGGSFPEWGSDLLEVSDGYIITGSSRSEDGDIPSNNGYDDIFIMKLNTTGGLQWIKALGASNDEEVNEILEARDGNYFLGVYTQSTDGMFSGGYGDDDFWLVKLDTNGDTSWIKNYGGSGYDYLTCMSYAQGSGYLLGGETASNDGMIHGFHGGTDIWLVRIDENGDTLWTKCYGGSSNESLQMISPTSDGGYLLTGFSYSSDGDVPGNYGGYDLFVISIDADGNIIWSKCFGGSMYDRGCYGIGLSEDEYFFAGNTESNDGDVIGKHGSMWADIWTGKFTVCTPVYDTMPLVICQGDSAFLGGSYRKEPGYYTDSLQTVKGCDSLLIVALSFAETEYNFDVTICEGQCYFAEGACRSVAGTYYDTLVSSMGCDSILITHLTVNPVNLSETIDTSICDGESIMIGGLPVSEEGTYYDTIPFGNDCAARIVNLTILDAYSRTKNKTICEGESYYAGGANQTEAGTYYDVYTGANGCDSTIITNLTVEVCSGFDGKGNDVAFNVFPVPTDDVINIEWPGYLSYELYSLNGLLIKKGNTSQINLSSFSYGIYMLRLYNSKGYVKMMKIVYQP
ncbi:MAG: T9SS type A sorting domain-containing protein [Bacteroidales bacterium]|nr:T9SS type A sorting domain-containing protein [Bacteroidales bacterium]